jgi:general secretion pathway protein G
VVSAFGSTLAGLTLIAGLALSVVSCTSNRERVLIRAKEAVLRNELITLRKTIEEYSFDRHKPPESLQDLVAEGYLRRVPVDPITGSDTSWKLVPEKPGAPGIKGIKSGSDQIGLDGKPYSEW